MTYCLGIIVDEGLVFAGDSRTNAGVDSVATFSPPGSSAPVCDQSTTAMPSTSRPTTPTSIPA